MKHLLFVLLLLFCPMVVFGQSSLVVKHSSDTLIIKQAPSRNGEEGFPGPFRLIYRPYRLFADADLVALRNESYRKKYKTEPEYPYKRAVDRVIGKYRVEAFYNEKQQSRNSYTYPKKSRYYTVRVVPTDTTEVEYWNVYYKSIVREVQSKMGKEVEISGRLTTRHNELLDYLVQHFGEVILQNRWNLLNIFIGSNGVVRDFNFYIDSITYHSIPTEKYVQFIKGLNRKKLFMDWRDIHPYDTIPAVYGYNVVPLYMADGDFVLPKRPENNTNEVKR